MQSWVGLKIYLGEILKIFDAQWDQVNMFFLGDEVCLG